MITINGAEIADLREQVQVSWLLLSQRDERIKDLERQLEEARTPWQPIETAPKDGRRLLLATPSGKISDGIWATTYKVWAWPYVMCKPTHWSPAPPLPAIDAAMHKAMP